MIDSNRCGLTPKESDTSSFKAGEKGRDFPKSSLVRTKDSDKKTSCAFEKVAKVDYSVNITTSMVQIDDRSESVPHQRILTG